MTALLFFYAPAHLTVIYLYFMLNDLPMIIHFD
jgi:hypothetical protein